MIGMIRNQEEMLHNLEFSTAFSFSFRLHRVTNQILSFSECSLPEIPIRGVNIVLIGPLDGMEMVPHLSLVEITVLFLVS